MRRIASRIVIDIGIVDLAVVPASGISTLRRLGINIICTHRFADEFMWAQALEAGALDLCYDDDAAAMISAVGKLLADRARAAAA